MTTYQNNSNTGGNRTASTVDSLKRSAVATGEAAASSASSAAHAAKDKAADAYDAGKSSLSHAADSAKNTAAGAYEAGKTTLASAAAAAKNTASDAYETGKSSLSNAADSAVSAISSVAGDTGRAFADTIEEHKTAGAQAVAGLARSARETADGFQESSPQLANAVRTVADRVESVSNSVRDQTLSDMIDAMSDFAKRKPVAFLGCGIVAGLVLSRLLTPASRS